MPKRFYFFLLVVVLFMSCSSNNSSKTDTTAAVTTAATMTKNTTVTTNVTKEEENNIPILLRKPEQWGDAPNFTAVRVGGEAFKLSSLKGKVILLNFWSVDCPACKMQIPVFVKLYKQYEREKLEIVGICLDQEALVERFTKSVDMNYILILANQEIVNKYGRNLRFLPFTLVIDQRGNVAQKHVGFTFADVFEKEIKELF